MADETTTTAAATAENAPAQTATAENAPAQQSAQAEPRQDVMTTEAIEKYIQSQVDKQMAEERKKSANLQKELDKAKKEKMSAEELKKYEDDMRDKELNERAAALTERENRLFAIEAIKDAGLDDGSKQSLELVDFVMGNDEDAIKERVKAFKGLVDRFVSARVEQTFKANGRVPTSGGKSLDKEENTSEFAELLGKRAAETAAQAAKTRNYYIGGQRNEV